MIYDIISGIFRGIVVVISLVVLLLIFGYTILLAYEDMGVMGVFLVVGCLVAGFNFLVFLLDR